jgi:uncharacterized membrane protein
MSTAAVLALAFAIGLIDGLRSMTAPAAVAWAARLKWLDLHNSFLGFMGATVTTYVLTAAAIVELVVDKLPNTPSRKAAPGLTARIVLGGLSGASLCVAANQAIVVGAGLGIAGSLAGAFLGYELRTRLVKSLKVPDFVIAVLEDAVAIGGGFFIVSRF